MDNTLVIQTLLFLGPTVLFGAAWALGLWSGKKTNLSSIGAAIGAGLTGADLSWLPQHYSLPITAGFGLAALVSNTVLTERKKTEDPDG